MRRLPISRDLAGHLEKIERAVRLRRGNPIKMKFVRIEPFVVPKQSLTGLSTERVDTRVLQVIYKFPQSADHSIYVGQQLDIFIKN